MQNKYTLVLWGWK